MQRHSAFDLYRYRHFILRSIQRELASRFSRSRLGGLWMLFHPLAQAAIYAFILSSIMSMKLPGIDSRFSYAIYLLSGMLGWTLFSEIITRCTRTFIDNADIIRKMEFPHVALPIIAVGVSLASYLMLLSAILIIYALLGHHVWSSLLWIIPITAVTVVFAASIGVLVGVLNVFLRDLGEIVAIVIQLLFWFTPIIYQVSMLPESIQGFIELNPAFYLIEMYHAVLVFDSAPSSIDMIKAISFSLIVCIAATFIYCRAADDIADVV